MPFRSVSKSMTLDDLEWPICTLLQKGASFGAHHKNLNEGPVLFGVVWVPDIFIIAGRMCDAGLLPAWSLACRRRPSLRRDHRVHHRLRRVRQPRWLQLPRRLPRRLPLLHHLHRRRRLEGPRRHHHHLRHHLLRHLHPLTLPDPVVAADSRQLWRQPSWRRWTRWAATRLTANTPASRFRNNRFRFIVVVNTRAVVVWMHFDFMLPLLFQIFGPKASLNVTLFVVLVVISSEKMPKAFLIRSGSVTKLCVHIPYRSTVSDF